MLQSKRFVLIVVGVSLLILLFVRFYLPHKKAPHSQASKIENSSKNLDDPVREKKVSSARNRRKNTALKNKMSPSSTVQKKHETLNTNPQKWTLVSKFAKSFGESEEDLGYISSNESDESAPNGIAVAPNGDIIIIDQVKNRLQIFGKDGKRKQSIQGKNISGAEGIDIGEDNNLYLIDTLLDRKVFIFDSEGEKSSEADLPKEILAEDMTDFFQRNNSVWIEKDGFYSQKLFRLEDGNLLPAKKTLYAGKISTDGQYLIQVAISKKSSSQIDIGLMTLNDEKLVWKKTISYQQDALISTILFKDSTPSGFLFIAWEQGVEDPKTFDMSDASTIVAKISIDSGEVIGFAKLASTASRNSVGRAVSLNPQTDEITLMRRSESGIEIQIISVP